MKTIKIVSLGVAIIGTLFTGASAQEIAQPVITSYASRNPALEATLPSLDEQDEIPTTIPFLDRVSFSTTIVLPTGTTSATINSATFSLVKRVGGVTVNQLSNIPMNNSAWGSESGTGRPALFSKNASGTVISLSGPLATTPIPNAGTIFMTDQKFDLGVGPFGKMIQEGDFYTLSRSINISWNVSGSAVVSTLTLNTESTVVIWFYPTAPPVINSVTQGEGQTSLSVQGVTPESLGKTWFIEESDDLGITDPWVVSTNGSVSGNTVVSFPVLPEQPRRFWRVKYITNPGSGSET